MNQNLILNGETFLFSVVSVIFLIFTYVLPRPSNAVKAKTMLYLRFYIMFAYFAHLFFSARFLLEGFYFVSVWGYNILTMLMVYSLLYASLHRFAIPISSKIRWVCLSHFVLVSSLLALIIVTELTVHYKQLNIILAVSSMLFFNYALIRRQNAQRNHGENVFGFSILACGLIVLLVSPIMLLSVEPTEEHFSYIVTLISIACSSLILFAFAVSTIHSLVRKLQIEMDTDRLTGVRNRNYFYEVAAEILSFGSEKQSPASIIICDIDNFKQINDRYGHIAGDLALVGFAECLQDNVGTLDSVIRLGGEEFLILMPETDEHSAVIKAELIRRAVCEVDVAMGTQSVFLTASFGVLQINPDRSVDDNISFADSALDQAKRNGKNQVAIYSQ